jgi:prepilin-type N-terminal cleavage/methylation domain-containing protein
MTTDMGRRQDGTEAGFTVLELLAVMAVLSIIMGLSVASLNRMGKGPALEVAERQVRMALMRVRTASREQAALGDVLFVPGDAPSIRISQTRDAGSWHFDEDKSRQLGGRNNFAVIKGGAIEEGGTVRRCVTVGAGDTVVCDTVAGYDPVRGFDISLDVRMESDARGGVVCAFGDTFSLELSDVGGASATLTLEGSSEATTLASEKELLVPGTWCRLRLTFDGFEVHLYVHGVLEASKSVVSENEPGPRRVESPDKQARLTFGSKTFSGSLDEISYRTVEDEEIHLLADGHEGLDFALQSPLRVRFDAQGRLDPRLHQEEVLVKVLQVESGITRQVSVDLTGVIR